MRAKLSERRGWISIVVAFVLAAPGDAGSIPGIPNFFSEENVDITEFNRLDVKQHGLNNIDSTHLVTH